VAVSRAADSTDSGVRVLVDVMAPAKHWPPTLMMLVGAWGF
jgi:hypothetical protein